MTARPGVTKVGFIGTGVMGKSMAGHIMDAGYELHVYTRTAAKAEELVKRGAIWHDSPASLAAACDVIITIVGYPKDVREIYLADDGILQNAKPGTYVIDMTTSSPKLAVEIYETAKSKGIFALDAPVSGGDVGARNAKLSIMVGSDESALEAVLPILEQMGTNIVRQGPAGAGQHAKLSNQIAIAGTMIGVVEALTYARNAGLDPELVLKSISAGAAGSFSMSNLAPRMLQGDFEPGFYVKHFLKDIRLALDVTKESGNDLPGIELAESVYARLVELGFSEKGTQVLYKLYNQ